MVSYGRDRRPGGRGKAPGGNKMKKLIITGITTAVLAATVVTAQTTYACFCIRGIIWEAQCDKYFPPKPAQQTPVQTPAEEPTPVEETETPVPTTPVDVDTPVPTTPTPVVTTASAVTTTPSEESPMAELPQTGASDTMIALAALGVLTYGGVYLARLIKH